ncbi:MAG: lipopolysaccharide kinase InaA family protein [Acidimicrobiales bacterium]
MVEHPSFRKPVPSPAHARWERRHLRLVQGTGIVPLVDSVEASAVVTMEGAGSLADLLAEVGRLDEAACRAVGLGVGAAIARVHSSGLVHGDVKPSNVVFAPEGGLWLVDFDAAGPAGAPRRRSSSGRAVHGPELAFTDDVVALASTVVECATGKVVDPTVAWSTGALEQLGCPPPLAVDAADVLRGDAGLDTFVLRLGRRPARLPGPGTRRGTVDPTPTVDVPTTVIAGLAPPSSPSPTHEVGEQMCGTRNSAHPLRKFRRSG